MDVIENLDLCNVIVQQMQQLQFSAAAITKVQSCRHYQTAMGQPESVQKTYLTLTLAGILNSGNQVVPAEIRLGLNMSPLVSDWLTDIKLIVLPFIKANEDKLFKL